MIPFKICCIKNTEESQLAYNYGANVLGLVGPMPSGLGPIPISTIRQIADQMRNQVETWLLTSKTKTEQIIEEYAQVRTSGIQLVDEVEPQTYAILKDLFPDLFIVQVLHIQTQEDIEQLLHVDPTVDALLLDSGSPTKSIKILGGTGTTHDWNISAEIVKRSPKPVYLAGGLNVTNVHQAIEQVKPYGLDLCSGLRTDGQLNEQKLKEWTNALNTCN